MSVLIDFIRQHQYFAIAVTVLNILLIWAAAIPIMARIRSNVLDAKGGRGLKRTYSDYISGVKRSIREYDKREDKPDIYNKVKAKLKRAGYRSEYSAVVYLFLKYPVVICLSLLTFITSYPKVYYAVFLAVYLIAVIELVVRRRQKSISGKLEMSIYKLYKYLHNQVSSGIQPAEAIKSVYEIVEGNELRELLILLSAKYSRTNDIDLALEDFKSNFTIHEADAFCVAIKQGIDTGNNEGLLQRQEAVMFKKYLNRIQAETDACKTRSMLAAAFFVVIIVVMLSVPLFNDVKEAIGKIFIN